MGRVCLSTVPVRVCAGVVGVWTWSLQHLYYPVGVVELSGVASVELKASRDNAFRLHAGDRVLSLVAPSSTALGEWCAPLHAPLHLPHCSRG
jgi:hypothetical protein